MPIRLLVIIAAHLFGFSHLTQASESITVAVATNFIQPMHHLSESFERDTGYRVKIVSGSSGKLYAQIINGAPFHLFFSADADKPAALEKAGLIQPGSRFTYARGELVLWTAKSGEIVNQATLMDNQMTRLAIANPKLAPYGLAAQEVLVRLERWSALQAKLVYGENIGQTYHFAATANAQYAFIALSQLKANDNPTNGSYWRVPLEFYSPIEQQAVTLRLGEHHPIAAQFSQFMRSENVRLQIQQFGYQSAGQGE